MNGPDGTGVAGGGETEMRLDDPALMAEIEAEFAELAKEIERISGMPRQGMPPKSKLLDELRKQWRDRLVARGDRPEWRARLDETLSVAVEELLEKGIHENPDGSLGFALQGDVVQNQGGAVLRALLAGFQNVMASRFPAQTPPPAAAPAPAAPGGAPPANPLQGLLQGLMGALASAVQTVKLPPPGQAGAPAPTNAAATGGVAGSETQDLVQPVTASVSFSSKPEAGAAEAAAPGAAAPDAAAPGAGAPGAAAGAIIQQFFQAFGQALKPAMQNVFTGGPVTVPVAPPPPAPDFSATPQPEAPLDPNAPPVQMQTSVGYDLPAGAVWASPESRGAPGETAPATASQAAAPGAAPGAAAGQPQPQAAPRPAASSSLPGGLAGLGQWLQTALTQGAAGLAKAGGAATAGLAKAAEAASKAAPAVGAAPTQSGSTTGTSGAGAAASQAPGAVPMQEATIPAAAGQTGALKIDFAGLLQSIFKGAKVTVGQSSITPANPLSQGSPTPAEAAVAQVASQAAQTPVAVVAPEPAAPAAPETPEVGKPETEPEPTS